MATFDTITSSDKVVQKFGGAGTNGVGQIISAILPFIYVAAGLLLLVTLIMGGITLMTAAGDANKMKQGYGQLTAGLIGFIIIFVSFFIAQILQIALGIKFL
ncbi:hypothetical protein CO009_00055 [Candidatus Shapirobacteria bacterium CG_4_8_14_3_um_filter_35_11]|uniref:Uncharacterized protein n=4 Tax=Candidatus Shapironibacteriota TaxID=1752721 RepID=A0A1J5HPK5_9BACT|nr:MAG: hypothetical protein AUK05_01640 [Candidatus Shapirobacteria bacterium CG2_30_35_20]PIV06795.1 MAG: hypothetical protein COS53_03715 [Candidatus Shapirobacteria bacterium CG03_land_8_20_14_0_80_35_14]PIX67800.1 MAG: hypothetical protein COZ41_03040 [Candidatus Shapirobacteria bacterium CG_4_10_14_3_um_filter_35_13]PJC81172.1 MAG: hypothetical protein CO009_00055 [Candidatus Shapirobacteria bacterium CG_4_8_14_3_um_filter_35_11]